MADDTPPDELTDELTYSEAVAALEELLDQLEGDEIDIDRLASQVRHAAALIRFCRQRLADARVEVEQIVADLEAAEVDGIEDDGADEG